MKYLVLIAFLFFTAELYAQFDVDKYEEFLNQHEDMSYKELLQEYPAGRFLESNPTDFEKSMYYGLLDSNFNFSDEEIELVRRHGFMVTDRKRYRNFTDAYYDLWIKDLPVYISADAILHAFHYSFDNILKYEESNLLSSQLREMLDKLTNYQEELCKGIPDDAEYVQALQDYDLYISVAGKILDDNWQTYYKENADSIDSLMTYIDAQEMRKTYLFSDTARLYDFSQFKPRGHYTDSDRLEKYFKAMMWLGRTDLYITPPEHQADSLIPPEKDIKRQILLSALLSYAIQNSGGFKSYQTIDDTMNKLIGKQDNITVDNINNTMKNMNITHPSELINDDKWKILKDSLVALMDGQLYSSHILMSHIDSVKQANPNTIFALLGQRPILDGYIAANVVYDQIIYNEKKVARMLPSSFDILFALGNDATIQLLASDLNKYFYSDNLAATRYLIDNLDQEYWQSSYYTGWLNGIRTLNPPKEREYLPKFMQTAAWQQKNMSTQLASWAELRHDFNLYTKESYSDGLLACEYIDGYVEPVPELYRNLKNTMGRLSYIVYSYEFIINWKTVCDKLISISEKELNGVPLDTNDKNFINSLISIDKDCNSDGENEYFSGWYNGLFYDYFKYISTAINENVKVVADFHTSPTDEKGNTVGWVKHIGTGPVNLAIISTEMPDGSLRSFAGPVYSYYETVELNFSRLTDDEWTALLEEDTLYGPDLCNLYRAGRSGEINDNQISLMTYTNNSTEDNIYTSGIQACNYPNPAVNSTIIAFTLPHGHYSDKIDIIIYDISGNPVNSYSYKNLSPGKFQLRWECDDKDGNKVSPGAYIYQIRSGGLKFDGRIIVVE